MNKLEKTDKILENLIDVTLMNLIKLLKKVIFQKIL